MGGLVKGRGNNAKANMVQAVAGATMNAIEEKGGQVTLSGSSLE